MEIKDIEKIKLNPDDVLLVTIPEDLPDEDVEASRQVLKKSFPKNTIIFKPESISVEVIKPSKKEKP